MLERTFTYTGFDGKEYKDKWYFFLSKADLLEIHLGSFVGLDVLMKRLIDTQNGKEIMAIIKEIILKSVGRPSADGKRFVRNDEIRDEFYQTDAYSQLFEELVMDSEKAVAFVKAVIPSDLARKINDEELKHAAEGESLPTGDNVTEFPNPAP